MATRSGEAEVLEALADPDRLEALRATGLLSPGISDALDDLARLARDVLGVPVALATLVDPDGQSFIGSCGLEEPWASSRRMPLAYSFCQYVVADASPLIVSDARDDAVLRHSRAVTELRMTAYAGFPILDDGGQVLGSFCALDTEPRDWSDTELSQLEVMARVAAREVASHRTTQQLALTVRKNAELIDSALEAIVSADVEGRIVGWNRRAEELFGWSVGDVLGRRIEDVIVPERLADLHSAGFAKVAAGGSSTLTGQRIRVPARHRDGHELLVELTLTTSVPRLDGTRFHAFMHDVTQLKHDEEEREALYLREAAQLEELRRLYELRQQLVAVVSHELRSPLGTILGFSKLLLEERGSLSRNQQRMLTIIERGANRMLGIVSDLLVLEDVGRAGVDFDRAPVDLAEVVQDAAEALTPTAVAGGVTVHCRPGGPTLVTGDEHRLRQVLDNLVGNAIKYTPVGGEVTVTVTGGDPGGTATLTVADTGIGIPEDERDRLFERFFRSSTARTAGIPGTGLGLAVVRAIVDRHGGRVEAAPGPGGVGTVFTVELPTADATQDG